MTTAAAWFDGTEATYRELLAADGETFPAGPMWCLRHWSPSMALDWDGAAATAQLMTRFPPGADLAGSLCCELGDIAMARIWRGAQRTGAAAVGASR